MKLTERSSGILLPLSSVPGTIHLGAMGQGARRFVDFLVRSGQRWWQILPVNPIDICNSPYSSCSAFAGEPLYIDLAELVEENLLSEEEIQGIWYETLPTSERLDRANYNAARAERSQCWNLAYQRYKQGLGGEKYRKSELAFLHENAYWLDDYTLFIAFSEQFKTLNWKEWPEPFRQWNADRILSFEEKVAQLDREPNRPAKSFWTEVELARDFCRFRQLVFNVQWQELRSYCHANNVWLLGDVPIYVGLASADTWSHPDLFQIDINGNMLRVAGVPADAFNPNGQRWNSPLYDWPRHETTGFDWWIHRMRHALSRYDVLRLDHFIGFYNYYSFSMDEEPDTNHETSISFDSLDQSEEKDSELPLPSNAALEPSAETNADTAIDSDDPTQRVYEKGWVPGPQEKLFDALFTEFSREQFLAEDLGVMNRGVHRLRDHYHLPGMNVLQFSFDHQGRLDPTLQWVENSVACTGTHDTSPIIDWLYTLEKMGPHHWNPTNYAHVWHVLLKYEKEEEKVTMDFSVRPEQYMPEYDFWRYSVVPEEDRKIEIGIPDRDPPIRADIRSLRPAAIRAVMQSKSQTALFPIQDILGLGPSARMNFPGKSDGNWQWRLSPELLTDELADELFQWTQDAQRTAEPVSEPLALTP